MPRRVQKYTENFSRGIVLFPTKSHRSFAAPPPSRDAPTFLCWRPRLYARPQTRLLWLVFHRAGPRWRTTGRRHRHRRRSGDITRSVPGADGRGAWRTAPGTKTRYRQTARIRSGISTAPGCRVWQYDQHNMQYTYGST